MLSLEAFAHYRLGVEPLDTEHWEILDSLRQLSDSRSRKEDLRIVEHIVDLWSKHAMTEERTMKSMQYPYAEWHIKEHSEMMGRFRALKERIVRSSEYHDRSWIASELQVIVCQHIDTHDMQIHQFIKQRNSQSGDSHGN